MNRSASIQLSDWSSADETSAAMPLLMGFVIVMILPVIAMVMFKSIDRILDYDAKNGIVTVHAPMFVVWMYLVSYLAIVVIFLGWCYVKTRDAKNMADVTKARFVLVKSVMPDVVSQCVAPTSKADTPTGNMSVTFVAQKTTPVTAGDRKIMVYAQEGTEATLSS